MSVDTIGKQIASLRKEKGIKQEELANFVGVSIQAVSKWENGGVPDTELLPKIADFFSVSVDSLFGRNITDYRDLQSALKDKIQNTPREDRFKLVFNYCWDMERAIMPFFDKNGKCSIEDFEQGMEESGQIYSSVIDNNGFTRMGIANRSQYFLIVPDPKNTDDAYFNGIDYPAFFRDFADEDVWSACVFLNKRDYKKAFTTSLLVKKLGIDAEKAGVVLAILNKYKMVYATQIEMDDEMQTVYHFAPTPSFVALLIFAQELINKPDQFNYYSENREMPYLK